MSRLGWISLLGAGISVIMFVVTRFLLGTFVPFLYIPMGLFVIFILMALWADRKFYSEFFTMRTTKNGMNMGAVILLMVVLLIGINYLGARHNKVFDITPNKINSLSPQTVKLLNQLDADLLVRLFYQKGIPESDENKAQFKPLIQKFQDVSSHVKLEFIEVNERPDLTEEYGVKKGAGVIFLDYKGRRGRVDRVQEQEVVQAMMTVMREKEKKIYFLTGHGEGSLDDGKTPMGLLSFKQLLEGNRYKVAPLSLIVNPRLPEDAQVIVISGPNQQFLDIEIKVLKDFLSKGGNLFLALDRSRQSNANELLNILGLQVNDHFVVTVMNTVFGKAIDPTATVGNVFSTTNEVTKVFGKDQMAIFRLPMSLKKMDKMPEGISAEEIVGAGANTMAYKDTNFKGESEKGPFSIAMAVTGKLGEKEFRALIFADDNFDGNQLIYQNLNRDLALNSIAYLAKDESIISISPKEPEVTKMELTPTKFSVFIIGFIVPLPIILLSLGLFFWFRRRNA